MSEMVTLEVAERAIAASKARATEINQPMNIAVVDSGARLVAFARMDGAIIGSIDISQRKAMTAMMFKLPTGELGVSSQPGASLYAIEHTNGGLVTFPGGVLIEHDGEIVGAVGVSAGTVEQDHDVASAGAAAAFAA